LIGEVLTNPGKLPMIPSFLIDFGYVCVAHLIKDPFSELRCAYTIFVPDDKSDWEAIFDLSKVNDWGVSLASCIILDSNRLFELIFDIVLIGILYALIWSNFFITIATKVIFT
jgi:hypothetical protein